MKLTNKMKYSAHSAGYLNQNQESIKKVVHPRVT